ncbi:prepilin-type N-terminal cleavage/methylation domain-containing protein [uncultured Clostridium sp.]|uniref:type IV pilus modification PilV family protein n=1 Tax=uncultured Clostridium sp. TaxID=59620 RepID=UPI0028E648B4|nr:prepilin-type N-terminal cleavage/methylation domain-containing protein [uncultured Clostridium sp.]
MKNICKKHQIPMLKIINKNKGFTLIEIIIAFALFGIMMVGIYGIVISAMNTNKDGEVKQKAALYGQKIFEDIKSGPKNIDGNYKIGDINLTKESANKFIAKYEFESGYKAIVNIERNTDIILDKDYTSNSDEENSEDGSSNEYKYKIYNFKFDIKSDGAKITIENDNDSIKLNNIEKNSTEFYIETVTKDSKKIVKIKTDNNSLIANQELKKDGVIKLTLNCSEYNSTASYAKYKDIKIHVSNEDENPVYVSIKKKEELDVKIVAESGVVKPFSNLPDEFDGIKSGELYDVTVEIKNKDEIEFIRKASQNINFN